MNVKDSYFAGLFDGEGCVGIRTMLTDNTQRGITYATYAKVGMTNLQAVQLLKETFGGSLGIKSENRANRQDVFTWCVVGKKAKAFLESIRPYTIVKSEAIENALEFQRRVDSYKEYRITDEEWAIRTELYRKARAFNVRGSEALKIKNANSEKPVTDHAVGNPEPSSGV